MPEERNDDTSVSVSKDSHNSKESKEIEEVKAKIANLEAKVVNNKAAGGEKEKSAHDTQAFKEKVGTCPLCDDFYYYEWRKGKTKGQILMSAFLSLCPKYIAANVDTRSTMMINNNACALCTDQRHQRPACQWKTPKPCREPDCQERHHPTLQGDGNQDDLRPR